jgi:hypothetical protein
MFVPRHNKWTEQDSETLKQLWNPDKVDEIAEVMGRHRLTVLYKAKDLGLREPRSQHWSDDEMNFLRDNYPMKHAEWCAEQLKRPIKSVYDMANKHGIKAEWTYRRIDDWGYSQVVLPGSRWALEHRLVMEEFLGRKLGRSEHVHHLDMNKLNNNLDNLVIVLAGSHNTIHALIKRNDVQGLVEFANRLNGFDKPKYERWLKSFLQRDIV